VESVSVTFELIDNNQVYCWLRHVLEPRYRVIAEPNAAYFSEFLFRYCVLDGNQLLHEFSGDFRTLQPGQLVEQANTFVARLNKTGITDTCAVEQLQSRSANPPIVASRLIPLRTDATYFSSGRAAFTYLLRDVVKPRRVWLPTYICWSLVSAMQTRFPETQLLFYPVDRQLNCQWPTNTDSGDAVVFVHYFGHACSKPDVPDHCVLLEDISHVLTPGLPINGQHAFGSLRKTFRIADGGVLLGRYHPFYESDDQLAVRLRWRARDWRDLREAENMVDRVWTMSDMSSQSMWRMLSVNVAAAAEQRQRNQRFLERHFPVGNPMISYRADEVPLLQNVLFSDTTTRDSLRSFLASRGIFSSIHWPLHPLLAQQANSVDSTEAAWLEQHVLSIPVADDFNETQMAFICDAASEWQRSGV